MARTGAWRGLWVLGAAAILLAISTPSLTDRLPLAVLPALGVLGAALVVRSFVRAVLALRRAPGGTRGARVAAVVLTFILAVVFAVLPFAKFLTAMGAVGGGSPRILAGFGDRLMAEGYPRLGPGHTGVDLAGPIGTPVLAAADGRIAVARDNGDDCGLTVVIEHEPHGYRTIYCHLATASVTSGARVARGQPIGAIGRSGQRAWPGYEHVHWMLRRGRDLEDPIAKTVGCFDGATVVPADRLVLTYPVNC